MKQIACVVLAGCVGGALLGCGAVERADEARPGAPGVASGDAPGLRAPMRAAGELDVRLSAQVDAAAEATRLPARSAGGLPAPPDVGGPGEEPEDPPPVEPPAPARFEHGGLVTVAAGVRAAGAWTRVESAIGGLRFRVAAVRAGEREVALGEAWLQAGEGGVRYALADGVEERLAPGEGELRHAVRFARLPAGCAGELAVEEELRLDEGLAAWVLEDLDVGDRADASQGVTMARRADREVAFHIPPPEVRDAAGRLLPLSAELVVGERGAATLTTRVACAELARPELAWPVDFDPTVSLGAGPPIIGSLHVAAVVPGSRRVQVATVFTNFFHDQLDWAVEWGDGAVDVGASNIPVVAQHAFELPGRYAVRLSVCDGAGRCTSLLQILQAGGRDCSTLDEPCSRGRFDLATGFCVSVPAREGQACDDGSECTERDLCHAGVCRGDALLDGVACDDGLFCTLDDACSAGACEGTPRFCPGDSCMAGACDETEDVCGMEVADDRVPCDDGLACTINDRCVEAQCGGDVLPCHGIDGTCARGACSEAQGGVCVSVPLADGLPCDDGVFCTVRDVCAGGECAGGFERACAPGGACVEARCDAAVDACVEAPLDGGACDDEDPCTGEDACAGGSCAGVPRDCGEVGSACEIPRCDGALGCVADALPDGAPCDDGRAETALDACAAAACEGAVASCAEPLPIEPDQTVHGRLAGAAVFAIVVEETSALVAVAKGADALTLGTCCDLPECEIARDVEGRLRAPTLVPGVYYLVATGAGGFSLHVDLELLGERCEAPVVVHFDGTPQSFDAGTCGREGTRTGSCGGEATAEVFFEIEVPGDMPLVLHTVGSEVDTVLYVIGGCDLDRSELGCSDDAIGRASYLALPPGPARTIVAVVDGFAACGAVRLNVADR